MEHDEIVEIEIIEIEIFVREGKKVPKGKHYKIRINNETFVIHAETITGTAILELVNETPATHTVYQHFHHGHVRIIHPEQHVDLTEPGIEVFSTEAKHEEHHEVSIFVNSREKKWNKRTISYEEVIILAFGTYSDDNNIVYTVTYSKGTEPHHEGSLVKGQSVKVKKGMVFNVTQTNRS